MERSELCHAGCKKYEEYRAKNESKYKERAEMIAVRAVRAEGYKKGELWRFKQRKKRGK